MSVSIAWRLSSSSAPSHCCRASPKYSSNIVHQSAAGGLGAELPAAAESGDEALGAAVAGAVELLPADLRQSYAQARRESSGALVLACRWLTVVAAYALAGDSSPATPTGCATRSGDAGRENAAPESASGACVSSGAATRSGDTARETAATSSCRGIA